MQPFVQPLMEMVGNRLWKRYVTACLVTYVRQPLMETVCDRLFSYLPC
jgi:hypothetical protein